MSNHKAHAQRHTESNECLHRSHRLASQLTPLPTAAITRAVG
jgi:hypothetical protein